MWSDEWLSLIEGPEVLWTPHYLRLQRRKPFDERSAMTPWGRMAQASLREPLAQPSSSYPGLQLRNDLVVFIIAGPNQ